MLFGFLQLDSKAPSFKLLLIGSDFLSVCPFLLDEFLKADGGRLSTNTNQHFIVMKAYFISSTGKHSSKAIFLSLIHVFLHCYIDVFIVYVGC